jgi:signal transduction histidine kinase
MSRTVTYRTPRRADVVLGATVVTIALAMLLLLPLAAELEPEAALSLPEPSDWQWWAGLSGVVAQGACLAWISAGSRRALVAVAAVSLLVSVVPLGAASGITGVAVLPAAHIAARRRAAGNSWAPWILATALISVAGVFAALHSDDQRLIVSVGAAVLQALALVWLPAIAGSALAARAAMQSAREREALAHANEQEARIEAALSAERTAIARELHDIAAHHLSGIALMASAISQQIDTDPATAKASLADVRAQTRTLLNELRGLVALLRQDEGATVDVESLAGLETLIPAAAARGLDVTLTTTEGASMRKLAHGIGPLSQFAAYRSVQEALANAARHAPRARCTVEVRDAGANLEVAVTNGPDAVTPTAVRGHGGFGLRGMEERAALTRATLTYGPTGDGGWRVVLRVPRETGYGGTTSSGDSA